jgi:hypothetical protein
MIEDAWYFDRLEKIKPLTYHFLLRTTNLYKSIRRYILCCAVIALFFGGIYHLAFFLNSQSFHFDPQLEHQSFFSFFYYSVVTFTTLGFGDIVPLKGWLQALVIAEVTCGYIMLGFLISLISNYLLSRRNRM